MIYSGIEDMDIKSGGREMATVVYSNEEDGMCSFVIDTCCSRTYFLRFL